jgi:hypothetical protein
MNDDNMGALVAFGVIGLFLWNSYLDKRFDQAEPTYRFEPWLTGGGYGGGVTQEQINQWQQFQYWDPQSWLPTLQ